MIQLNSVGANIKKLRSFIGMSQAEFASQLDVTTVSVSNWETDKKEPSVGAVVSIAQQFHISADWILGTHNSDSILHLDEKKLVRDYRSLDEFGKRAVNSICEIELDRLTVERSKVVELKRRQIPLYLVSPAAGLSGIAEGEEYDMLDITDAMPQKADFAVRISGDSMEPYIHDGEIVYVQRRNELSNGEVGIFSVDGAMYCKQFYVDRSGTLSLLSANPDRADSNIIVSPESSSTVMVYGRVLMDHLPPLPY